MARTAIVFGLLLCVLSLFGMVAAMTKSPFQFVPLMFGIPVLFCGVVGLNPHRRRSCRTIAAGVMSLGLIVAGVETTCQAMIWSDRQPLRPVLFGLGVVMSLLCLVFVLIYLRRLFTDPRRRVRKKPLLSAAGLTEAIAPTTQGD